MTDELPTPASHLPEGQVLIYRDGTTTLQVRLDGQTVWLPQRLLAELFQVTVPNVNQHLKAIYDEGELRPEATIKQYLIVQKEGARQISRLVDHYNLDAILAVGYRVRSPRGTQFRQWATARLGELLVKGFTLDDERIKAGRTLGDDYFEELLARIRDIRARERMFHQKITDIYATSIDYDADAEITKTFFQTVQNKVHWAAHGHTAAEIVRVRADAAKPHMGLTSWKNAPTGPVRKADVAIAKNYLSHEEIDALNRIVSAYLEFAELQAKNRRPMHMAEWIGRATAAALAGLAPRRRRSETAIDRDAGWRQNAPASQPSRAAAKLLRPTCAAANLSRTTPRRESCTSFALAAALARDPACSNGCCGSRRWRAWLEEAWRSARR